MNVNDFHLGEELVINPALNQDFHICKVCFSIVKDPKCCNECEDLFCSVCVSKFTKTNNKCPLCRNSPFIERKINKHNKKQLNEMLIKCPLGCSEEILYENLQKHLDKCEYVTKIYKCTLCNCEIKVENNNLNKVFIHDNECSAMIQCPFCFNDFETSEIETHIEKYCDEKVLNCDVCKIKFPGKYQKVHDEFYCKKFEKYVCYLKEKILNRL